MPVSYSISVCAGTRMFICPSVGGFVFLCTVQAYILSLHFDVNGVRQSHFTM